MLRDVLKSAPAGVRIEGLSSQRATTLLVDTDFRSLGPALSWQGITCAAAAEEYYQKFGVDRFLKLTGLPHVPIYTIAKIAHLEATYSQYLSAVTAMNAIASR